MRARPFKKGTRIVTRTGGGGGYGDPFARPASEVLEDVRCGLVSLKKARELYGVHIDPNMKVVEARGGDGALAVGRSGEVRCDPFASTTSDARRD
jgi:N-methylhydantoinase B/oxoprolinase/acetone carboxylase alpha subunit